MSFHNKAREGEEIIKVSRTHPQVAVLMTMGQVFDSFGSMI